MWFTTGETRRANWDRTQAAREREQADRERERAARPENTQATTLLRLEELASEVPDLRAACTNAPTAILPTDIHSPRTAT